MAIAKNKFKHNKGPKVLDVTIVRVREHGTCGEEKARIGNHMEGGGACVPCKRNAVVKRVQSGEN